MAHKDNVFRVPPGTAPTSAIVGASLWTAAYHGQAEYLLKGLASIAAKKLPNERAARRWAKWLGKTKFNKDELTVDVTRDAVRLTLQTVLDVLSQEQLVRIVVVAFPDGNVEVKESNVARG